MQVDKDEHVFNVWMDKQENIQRKYVGDLSDMRTMDIRSLAGIPVSELQRESRGRFNGKYTVFDSDRKSLPLPPNAPVLEAEVSSAAHWLLGPALNGHWWAD